METKYHCENCSEGFSFYYAVSTKNDEFILRENSLQYHLIQNPGCNQVAAELRKERRQDRQEREYHEQIDYL
jgi:hypothetical protein